ncbi:uncharacterized protein [Rutidosis leptorrhynchoides]|uniref:uncharacterized protein n=1 Tax=Rutidosis leptorrhynchoides TaxID=125765 RepID=UPI003A996A7B
MKKDCIFRDRLKNVKNDLRCWSKIEFGSLENEINLLKTKANRLELLAESGSISVSDRSCWMERRKSWFEKENIKSGMLKQKARIRWILEGDENSKYFHSTIRRKFNKCNIRGLNINGEWNEEPRDVKETILNHFRKIFSAKNANRPSFFSRVGCGFNGLDSRVNSIGLHRNSGIERADITVGLGRDRSEYVGVESNLLGNGFHDLNSGVENINLSEGNDNNLATEINKISSEEAIELERIFSESEIWEAVNDCGSSKALGPDGFNLGFYKKFWNIIKGDLIEAINMFWEKGEISKGCNASFITLVPKKLDPVSLNDYRPISLIGSFYKVIAKLLANRLKKVTPNLVGYEQSAFIKGRNILDGALIANESLSFLKSKRLKSVIFKVDF